MAMNGSFAGGLADGLRNGVVIGRAYEDSAEARRKRELEKKLAAAMQGNPGEPPAPEGPGLQQIDVAQPVDVGTQGRGDVVGLQPIAMPGQNTAGAGGAASAGTAFGAELSGGSGWDQALVGLDTAVRRSDAQGAPAQKKSPGSVDYLDASDFGQVADGLTRAYRKALELGEPGRAMQLLADREKFVGQHREQAFNAAQSRYQLTGDPNSYVPFVNRFMPGGIEVTSIDKRAEQAGGAPVYDFVGVDTATGKPVQQPISEFMLQSFVRSVSDPKAQQAMVAQQAKSLWEAEQKRREKQLESQLRSDEELRKPRVLGKDQTLYVPDGKGGMRVGAEGSEAGKPKMVTSNKDFANHVMRIFKVDSMEGLGDDQRKQVSGIIATGENINRLNAGTPEGEVLTAGNLASLAQQVQAGTADIVPIRLGGRQFGFGVEHEGQLIRLPVSVVPKQVQEKIRARLSAATASAPGGRPSAGTAQAAPSAATAAAGPAGTSVGAGPSSAPALGGSSSGHDADRPEGVQLDAARAQLHQAEAVVRQLRTKPPGLKAGPEARARHVALLRQAENDVELARAAEQAAADSWARATEGSEITRAAMGRTNGEGVDGQL
ncbi:hypothetical protein M5J07_20810 [Achromobacter mucicolens]|uniref:hypothetical protein n=1 Tax=Achromobacter mucicolens TaxID=1389922 RepID=UPI0020A2C175|nr:hypothetical protein [Achromobacter mucicolens]MCP2517393.1 hypothetical protein [Achromobacter mucicolens]